MLAQLLDGRMPPARRGGLWILAVLVVLSGAFTAMIESGRGSLALLCRASRLLRRSSPSC